jgi:diketogulonate reductase-like aldo/keto reductase
MSDQLTLSSAIRLNNGVRMPLLGLGVFRSPPGEPTRASVSFALEHGYRHIDTATVPRSEIFVTTKLRGDDHGRAKKAFAESLKELGLDTIDLYLIHWPQPGKRLEAWDALAELQESGAARAVGVSNYTVPHLEELFAHSSVVPTVNQVEFHPFLFQKELLDFCKRNGIVLESYSPLAKARHLDHPVIVGVARRAKRTPAQVMLRWGLQHGTVVIPKSNRPERIIENSRIFDFELPAKDMAALDGIGEQRRTSWDPTATR